MTDAINPRTHTILLEANVWIVEELRFPPESFAVPQPFTFLSLPVNLKGHTGAFCRPVILLP
jgi:kynurenine formamidase